MGSGVAQAHILPLKLTSHGSSLASVVFAARPDECLLHGPFGRRSERAHLRPQHITQYIVSSVDAVMEIL